MNWDGCCRKKRKDLEASVGMAPIGLVYGMNEGLRRRGIRPDSSMAGARSGWWWCFQVGEDGNYLGRHRNYILDLSSLGYL